jgi:uncharacterized protein involved in propanediol utilization
MCCGEPIRSRRSGLDGASLAALLGPGADAGVGWAACHHGELLQGVFAGGNHESDHALVTLPLRSRSTRATFRPSSDGAIRVFPEDRTKARRAAELAVELCAREGVASTGGRLDIVSNVPVGKGMGSSTSDVIATIKAVSDCYRVRLAPERIAQLAVLAERACDSIMIDDRVVLFAHRRGTVLEVLGCQLPPLVVVGCVSGPANGVDTLELPLAQYDQHEIETFCTLRAALRRAITARDIELLGRVATASARINQRFLPKPELDFLIALSGQLGAAGVQIAHSGTVVGLIFDVRLPDLASRIGLCIDALDREGVPQGDSFIVSA